MLNALRSRSAWKTLKGAANHLSPKLQLVLPSELQDAIQARIASKKPVTHKKDTRDVEKRKTQLQLMAADIAVPDGMFKEEPNNPLQQIAFSKIVSPSPAIAVCLRHSSLQETL